MAQQDTFVWKHFWIAFGLFVGAEALILRVMLATADNAFLHYVIVPAIAMAVAWRRSPRLRGWIDPASLSPRAVGPVQPTTPAPAPAGPRVEVIPAPSQPSVLVMGPQHADLLTRVDPFTRTRFAIGESIVLCGGRCGRAYKLVTCEHLQYRCPVDGAPLR